MLISYRRVLYNFQTIELERLNENRTRRNLKLLYIIPTFQHFPKNAKYLKTLETSNQAQGVLLISYRRAPV